jgi:hypothetical protein
MGLVIASTDPHLSQHCTCSPAFCAAFPAGGSLTLRSLLLANTTLASPQVAAFLPLPLQFPSAARLLLQDVQMVVSQQQLQQYAAFLQQLPSAVFVSDNVTFIHIRNFSSSSAAAGIAAVAGDGKVDVTVRSVTLIAPSAASLNSTPVTVLQALAASQAQQQQNSSSSGAIAAASALAAAGSDASGVITATDSYVLAATNATLLQLLQQLNSPQLSADGPLLVHLASNVSLAPRFWGSDWPAAGLVLRRAVVFVGSSWQPTSIDLGMEVGQVSM